MKRTILTGMVLILMLFLLPSCAAGVSQEKYDRVSNDLEVAEEKLAEALAYAEYLDVLMYPIWREAGLTPRFVFEDDAEWAAEVRSRASDMEDTKLINYMEELRKGSEVAPYWLWNHCLDRIEKALK